MMHVSCFQPCSSFRLSDTVPNDIREVAAATLSSSVILIHYTLAAIFLKNSKVLLSNFLGILQHQFDITTTNIFMYKMLSLAASSIKIDLSLDGQTRQQSVQWIVEVVVVFGIAAHQARLIDLVLLEQVGVHLEGNAASSGHRRGRLCGLGRLHPRRARHGAPAQAARPQVGHVDVLEQHLGAANSRDGVVAERVPRLQVLQVALADVLDVDLGFLLLGRLLHLDLLALADLDADDFGPVLVPALEGPPPAESAEGLLVGHAEGLLARNAE